MFKKDERLSPRVNLKWRVFAQTTTKGPILGLTRDISTSGAYVLCPRPLRLNEVFDMSIKAPDKSLTVKAKVVWSNMYGPDDEINPRGMGVRFLNISEEDRQFIAKIVNEHSEPEPRPGAMETVTLKVEEN